jgi:hypothetical protein
MLTIGKPTTQYSAEVRFSPIPIVPKLTGELFAPAANKYFKP